VSLPKSVVIFVTVLFPLIPSPVRQRWGPLATWRIDGRSSGRAFERKVERRRTQHRSREKYREKIEQAWNLFFMPPSLVSLLRHGRTRRRRLLACARSLEWTSRRKSEPVFRSDVSGLTPLCCDWEGRSFQDGRPSRRVREVIVYIGVQNERHRHGRAEAGIA